jgi:hypothetical protein
VPDVRAPHRIVGACLGLALVLGACGGGSGDDKADAQAVCKDMNTLASTGSKVLKDRSHWDPLIDRATTVKYAPLRDNANAFRTELHALDQNLLTFPDPQKHAGNTLGLVFKRCQEVGVQISAGS